MKRTFIALTALAATSVIAQSSVNITGGIGIGVAHIPDQSATSTAAAQASQTKLSNLGVADSAITFLASEDLGGGLRVSAAMNMRFNPTNGSQGPGQGSRAFQNVKLALSGGFGEVAAGRFNGPVDLMRGVGDHWFGYDHGATLFGHSLDATTRYDNTLQYTTPIVGGFKLAVAHSLKENSLTSAADMTEAAVSYAGGPLKAGLGITRNSGLIRNKDVTTLAAQYDFGVARPAVVHSRTDIAGVGSNRTSVHVTVPVGSNAFLRAGYERQKTDGFGPVTGIGFGGEYFLSKRTKLVADITTRNSKSSAVADWDGIGTFVGMKHSF